MTNIANWEAYINIVEDLLGDEMVLSMHNFPHHFDVSCYEHSVFVSYVAFRLARKLGLDYSAAARGGLLHDLYLYNSKERPLKGELQCFAHPKAALNNASEICSLSDKEENIIISHMWPLSKRMPRSLEAFVVNIADKYCATAEILRIWHRMNMRKLLPIPCEC